MNQYKQAYDFLRLTSARAFEQCDYDTAYHLVAASLHLAQAVNSEDWLSEISRMAHDQQQQIDKDAPYYQHSTSSARKRGAKPIFETVSTAASTAIRTARLKTRAFR